MSDKIRVLLADDHPLIRSGISNALSSERKLVVVAEAATGEETCSLCRQHQPDVLLLDFYMPGSSPLQTMATVRQHCPQIRIVILTAYDDDSYVRGLIAAGIDGYILKDEAVEMVVNAVLSAAQGIPLFSQSVVMKLAQAQEKQPDTNPRSHLSDREYQILTFIAQGWNNRRIAKELDLAEQTIRNIVSRIYRKLNVNSRAEAIIMARQCGME
ncbi:MAG: response regulator transcription factor [Chloroflexota bacterium]